MGDPFAAPPRRAVLKHVAQAVLLAIVVNGLIQLTIGVEAGGTRGGALVGPVPGWLIAAIWTALFAGLGFARGVLAADGAPRARRADRSLLILLLACAAYPLYTEGLGDDRLGLIGNALTLGLALWSAARIGARPIIAAPVAVAVWLAVASVAIVDQSGAAAQATPSQRLETLLP